MAIIDMIQVNTYLLALLFYTMALGFALGDSCIQKLTMDKFIPFLVTHALIFFTPLLLIFLHRNSQKWRLFMSTDFGEVLISTLFGLVMFFASIFYTSNLPSNGQNWFLIGTIFFYCFHFAVCSYVARLTTYTASLSCVSIIGKVGLKLVQHDYKDSKHTPMKIVTICACVILVTIIHFFTGGLTLKNKQRKKKDEEDKKLLEKLEKIKRER